MERIEARFIEYMNDYIQQQYTDEGYEFDRDKFNDEDERDDYISDTLRQDFFNSDESYISDYVGEDVRGDAFWDTGYLKILVEVCKYNRDNYDINIDPDEYLNKSLIIFRYSYQLSFDDRIIWEKEKEDEEEDEDKEEEPVFDPSMCDREGSDYGVMAA